jgi:ankyrin repeat protein
MQFIKNIIVFISCSFMSIHGMELNKYIEQHKDSPKELEEILIDMGRWEAPDLDAARKILELGVSSNAKDRGNIALDNPGAAALTTAAGYGKTEYVKLLLDFGANIEIKSPWDGRTALMDAALYGHDETVALLLRRGANPNATNCLKKTALIWAADNAHLGSIKLLLAADADISLQDEHGKTALFYARKAMFSQYQDKYDKIVELLEKDQEKKIQKVQYAELVAARINKSYTNISWLNSLLRK